MWLYYHAVHRTVLLAINPHVSCCGAGKKLKWVLIIGKQQSVYPTTAYGPPRIDSVKSSNNNQVMKQQGGEEIVITGIIGIVGTYFGTKNKNK